MRRGRPDDIPTSVEPAWAYSPVLAALPPTMRLRSLLAIAFAFALNASQAGAAEIRLGSLSLDWPAGYTLKSARGPFELVGPQGSQVLVTVLRPGPAASGSPEAVARMRGTVEKLLDDQAARAGQVVLPLASRTLPDGTQLLSIGSQASGLFRSGYLLQYALLARSGLIALLSFEGKGDAVAEHDGLQGLLASAQWTAGDGSPQEQAAFTDRVAALLRARLGDGAVVVAEPLTLKIGELQANLDRVNAFCRANAAGCNAELERYVQAIVDMQQQAAAPPSREALRLVVRTAEFAEGAAGTSAAAGKTGFIRRPVAEGLVAMLMLDSPRSARLVSEADCQALGLSADEAYALGLANLQRQLLPLAQAGKPVAPGAFGTLEGDFYESGRVLLHESWAGLARGQKGVLIVALPAKNLILYSADDSPAGLAALRTLARESARRSPGPLSEVLLRWSPSGWDVLR